VLLEHRIGVPQVAEQAAVALPEHSQELRELQPQALPVPEREAPLLGQRQGPPQEQAPRVSLQA
jgi:hypothetical protein